MLGAGNLCKGHSHTGLTTPYLSCNSLCFAYETKRGFFSTKFYCDIDLELSKKVTEKPVSYDFASEISTKITKSMTYGQESLLNYQCTGFFQVFLKDILTKP